MEALLALVVIVMIFRGINATVNAIIRKYNRTS
jgi:hypothetical protein